MKIKSNYIILIIGPTAIGKTKICIELAKKLCTKIISLDSRQIYKETNIGTAKPKISETKKIKHYLINSRSIKNNSNSGTFEKDIKKKINKLFKKKKIIIITGGTGLNMNIICNTLVKLPKVNKKIKKKINEKIKKNKIESIKKKIKKIDPNYYKKVDFENKKKIKKILEIYNLTSRPYSCFINKIKKKNNFKIIKIGLKKEKKKINKKINYRTNKMTKQGLFEESYYLYKFKEYNALKTLGYQEIFQSVEKEYKKSKIKKKIKINSKKYIKRQITWFKKNKNIKWFNINSIKKIYNYIKIKLI